MRSGRQACGAGNWPSHLAQTRLPVSLLVAIAITGCTSISDVTKTGRETYMVGVTVRGGVSGDAGAQAAAIKAANTFCASKGLVVQVNSAQGSGVQGLTPVGSVVHFSCISE